MTAAAPWLDLLPDDPFGLHVLPYGSYTTASSARPRVGVAVGPHVLDLTAASAELADVLVYGSGPTVTSSGGILDETLNCARNVRRSSLPIARFSLLSEPMQPGSVPAWSHLQVAWDRRSCWTAPCHPG